MYNISAREREVLELVSQGLSRKQVALSIHLSFHTVNDHVKNLQMKLDANNTAQLIRKGFETGFLKPNETNIHNYAA